MFSKSDYLAGELLDTYLVGGGATPHYVLSETIILPDGTGGTEAAMGRVAIQSNMQRTGRVADNATEIQLTAALPAGDNGKTFPFFGIFDANTAGNLLWAGCVGTNSTKCVSDPDANTICAEGNPFSDDDEVRIYGAVAGLTNGGSYFVVNASNDSFQLSLTQGGAAVTFTGADTLIVVTKADITPSTNDTVKLNAGALVIEA